LDGAILKEVDLSEVDLSEVILDGEDF